MKMPYLDKKISSSALKDYFGDSMSQLMKFMRIDTVEVEKSGFKSKVIGIMLKAEVIFNQY